MSNQYGPGKVTAIAQAVRANPKQAPVIMLYAREELSPASYSRLLHRLGIRRRRGWPKRIAKSRCAA